MTLSGRSHNALDPRCDSCVAGKCKGHEHALAVLAPFFSGHKYRRRYEMLVREVATSESPDRFYIWLFLAGSGPLVAHAMTMLLPQLASMKKDTMGSISAIHIK